MPHPFATLSEDELLRQSARLRAIALQLVADEATADDLAQEAWLELGRGGRGVRDLPAFMAGVVRKLSLRRRTSEHRRKRRERGAARAEALPGTAELNATLEAQRALVEELQALPASLREVLLLRYYEGHSAAEIARRFCVPASTVRSRLARGLADLRERLDRRYGSGREAWALALLRLPRAAAPTVGLGTVLTGVTTMNVMWKTAATLVALALVGGLLWTRNADDVLPTRVAATEPSPAELTEASPQVLEPAARQRDTRAPLAVAGVTRDEQPTLLRVVDRDSSQPAAFYAVQFTAEDAEAELLETDAHGRVELPAACFARPFELLAVDHPDFALEHPDRLAPTTEDRPEPGEELIFEVELGPSYELVLPGPAPRTEVTAFLEIAGFDGQGGWLDQGGVPLREGTRPWVRFPPELADEARLGRGPWFVRVRDRLGMWQAWGEVRTIRGAHPGPVELEGGAFGGVELRVKVNGAVPVTPIEFTLQATDGVGDWQQRMRIGSIMGEGGWMAGQQSLRFLLPGHYRVDLSARGVEQASREVDILAGETATLLVDLEQDEEHHNLVVRLVSQSERLEFTYVGVRARRIEGDGAWVHAERDHSDEAPGARFLLQGLEPGEWELELLRSRHLPEFLPASGIVVDADAGDVLFTCLDGDLPLLTEQAMEIIDAETGEPVQGGLTLWVEGESFLSTGFFGGSVDLPAMREGVSIDWVVIAPGYRPVLRLDDLYPPSLRGEPLTLRLERGWGCLVVTRLLDDSPTSSTTLAGVEVTVDGLLAGRTDALGRLLLVGDRMPDSIELGHPEYEHFLGSIDPETGSLQAPASVWPLNEFLR